MSESPREAELIEHAKRLDLEVIRLSGRWAMSPKYAITTYRGDHGPQVTHIYLEHVAEILQLVEWCAEVPSGSHPPDSRLG